MRKMPISIFSGIAAILITIVLYFTILGNIFSQLICLITLLGVVLAEAIVTALAYCSKGDPRKVAATSVGLVIIPISVILSVVYITKFPKGYIAYIGWYLATIIIVMAIVAVIWKITSVRTRQNDVLQSNKNNMLELRKIVKCIMLQANSDKFSKELEELEEKLHFSNDAVVCEDDVVIRQMLLDLENGISDESYDAEGQIKAISLKIDRRNVLTKNTI